MFVPYYCRRASGTVLNACAALLFIAGLFFGSARPATAEADEGLSLQQALARSLREHPRLAAYPYEQRAAEARALQAGLRPNPELALEIENIAGDGRFTGTDSAETTLALSQVIELGGKRAHRQSVAHFNSELVQRDYDLARLEVLADTAGRFLQVARAQRLLELAELADALATRSEQAVQARVNAGQTSRAALSQARIESLRAKLSVQQIRRQLDNARLQLAAAWGAMQADFDRVNAELFTMLEVPEFSSLTERLNQAPELTRFLTLERLRRAELELAQSRGRQNLRVGVGVKRFEETGDNALLLQFSMPLGVSDRNQGETAARRAEYERLDIEQRATRVELYAALHAIYQQLQQARETAQALQQTALPEAEQALDLIETGYRNGRFSYLELADARRQRLSVEQEAIDAAVDFHNSLLALERLTGEPLTTPQHSIMLPGSDSNAMPVAKDKLP